jgi:hypothetical protein
MLCRLGCRLGCRLLTSKVSAMLVLQSDVNTPQHIPHTIKYAKVLAARSNQSYQALDT